MACMPETSPVFLVYLVHLVRLVQLNTRDRPNRPDRRNGPNEQDRLADLFSILQLLCAAEQRYHPIHATHVDAHRLARGTLPHWSQYHPTHTGCDGGRTSRMDALSPRMSYRPCGPRTDRMDLDRHGLRHLWNGGIGFRPRHSREHHRRARGNRRTTPLQYNERDRKLFIDLVRWARIFAFVPGDRASSIPPSQSSVPFFIRKTLIRSNPASVSHALVSATG